MSAACRYGILVLSVEVLGGLAMLPYGLCLTMRVTNNQVPPPDDKGQVGGELAGWLAGCVLAACPKHPKGSAGVCCALSPESPAPSLPCIPYSACVPRAPCSCAPRLTTTSE